MSIKHVRTTAWGMVALALVFVVAGWWWRAQTAPYGTVLQQPKLLESLTLRSQDGKPWNIDQALGYWSIVFFGFTSCPDICPTSMQYLRDELAALPVKYRDNMRAIFVSVDPERDQDTVDTYAKNFSPQFMGFSGSPEQLAAAAAFFGVHFQKREAAGSKLGYTVDHNGDFFLVDPFGRWVKLYRPPLEAGALARDLSRVMSTRPSIEVADAWVRKPKPGRTVTGAYLKIKAKNPAAEQLVAVESPVAESVELHETINEGGTMQMRQVASFAVDKDGAIALQPGGSHIMLMGTPEDLADRPQVPMVLRFSKAAPMRLLVPLREM